MDRRPPEQDRSIGGRMRYRSLFLSMLLAAVWRGRRGPTGEPMASAASVKAQGDAVQYRRRPRLAREHLRPRRAMAATSRCPACRSWATRRRPSRWSSCRGRARARRHARLAESSTMGGSPSTSRFSCASSRTTRSDRVRSDAECSVEDRFVTHGAVKGIQPWTSFIQS